MVSTAAAKQIRNFSQEKLTIDLDLGDRSSCYCVLHERGRIVVEQKVSNTPKALQAAFRAAARTEVKIIALRQISVVIATAMHISMIREYR